MTTSAPSRANATATARPMPESPPVTTATRSVSLPLPTYVFSPWSGSSPIAGVTEPLDPGDGSWVDSASGWSCCCVGSWSESGPVIVVLLGRQAGGRRGAYPVLVRSH